jgi:hypothetical protein
MSRDGTLVGLIDQDRKVCLFDLASGKLFWQTGSIAPMEEVFPRLCVFSSDGRWLVTGQAPDTLAVWNLRQILKQRPTRSVNSRKQVR